MNTKPNNPDELILIDRQFSLRTAWKVCRWLFVSVVVSVLCDWIFPKEVRQWPFVSRMAVILMEFVPLLLWISDAAKWIRGMDELQRRITVASLFFAVSATLFLLVLWFYLDGFGFFYKVFGKPFMNNTWGIYTVADVYVFMSGFYGFGYLYFKRRYK
ncbi:MAG: hypothetical protein ACREFE_06075 [Limisphaerales bacterium]